MPAPKRAFFFAPQVNSGQSTFQVNVRKYVATPNDRQRNSGPLRPDTLTFLATRKASLRTIARKCALTPNLTRQFSTRRRNTHALSVDTLPSYA
jgi:hypothetical protein